MVALWSGVNCFFQYQKANAQTNPASAAFKDVESVFQSLNSKQLKIFSHTETRALPSKLFPLRPFALTWQPPAELLSSFNECSALVLKQKLFSTELSAMEATIKTQWERCESKWRSNSYGPWTHSQEILRMDFEPSQHPEVRMIQWSFKNHSRLRGYLFFKGGPEKKPLVILRPGVFSHLRSSIAERFLMMMLFEEGPFHLLLLPSNSGSDYIEDNHQIGFGDESEHSQTSEILDQLHDPQQPLNQYISRIHLVGMSLGNYGLFLTNANERKKHDSLLDRSLFLCPAIDLKSSFAQITNNQLHQLFLRLWFYLRLSSQQGVLVPPVEGSLFDFITTKVNQNTNALLALLPHYDFTHSLILWTQLDPVLPPEYNAKILVLLKTPPTHLLELPRGLHCSLATTYQWPIVSLTLRGYLNSSSLQSTQTAWAHNLAIAHPIKKILLHDLTLVGDKIKFYLLISFQNPLKTPQLQEISVPQHLSRHAWAFADFNQELQKSLIREFSSRLQWEQNSQSIKLSFH